MYCHQEKQFPHAPFPSLLQFSVQIRLTVGVGICYTENFLKCFYK